ncbi:SRPBCC family protein [Streptomyces sp. NPDC005195]|uniref:SRPBCC family protein n=1 Tax=Streptomyces sp. NPDC005195 TaxID=3154561 RepID=UPI0033A46EA7
MAQIEKSIEVDVSLRIAYTQWTRFDAFPDFLDGVEEVTYVSEILTHWKTRTDGVEREFDAEITEQIPDERVAWKTVDQPNWAAVITFEHLDDAKTKITLRLIYTPRGFTEKLGDRLGHVKRRAAGDLKNFKRYIESRSAQS